MTIDDRTTVRSSLLEPRARVEPLPAIVPATPVQPTPVRPTPAAQALAVTGPATGLQHAPRASAGMRLGAYLLDSLVIGALVFGGGMVIGLLTVVMYRLGSAGSVLVLMLTVALYAAIIAYPIVMNAKGQTIGKRMLRIAVVDRVTGQPIGMGRSLLRYLMMIVMNLPFGLGFLSIPMSSEVRGWHDVAADDVVVILPQS
jgi:uncharacterized RDD family membrane protein YckC